MKRATILGALLVVGTLSLSIAACQERPARGGQQTTAAKVVKVEKLKDNLYVLTGGGGNTALFLTTNGVTVVDTKEAGWGQPILDAIKTLTDKPVTTIINTHTHYDHVSGNVEFPASVEIVAHENTKANMEQMRPVTGLQDGPQRNIFKEHNGGGLPERTFKDKLTLGGGNDQIDLYYFGRGHTDGDAWIVFPALRVMHAGDIFWGKGVPILDANNGGSGVELPNTLARAASSVNNVDSIITGHSTVMTVSDLKEYAEFNREFLMAVEEAKKAGKSADEVAKSWTMPAKYAGYEATPPEWVRSNVQVIFDELH